ncbi:DUF2235 domain-containing protein [Methylobacterium sp. J-090]|uniref:DUF2235 domain-containing protein n=1 Tax=Methylobacterium sp. J-090 TaxID=2836666 RepID=UPI001FBA603D|nr:DUF2235 domain-containing protein [Methylobacterium sp. J-090]MCJ2082975.1 DUF2235 domain-containing protein [Methylobacterium sp. J-090]
MIPRRIVIFADGTGNAFTTQESNIWRLFQAIDQSQPDQIARYIPGVGTSGFRPFAMLDGATGIGVPSNVRKLYRFLCWNWRPGDEIWMFGFSRGAFTVRSLIGLIHHEGLVPAQINGTQVTHAEMDRNAEAAWRSYRQETAPDRTMLPTVRLARKARDLILAAVQRVTGRPAYRTIKDETTKQGRRGSSYYPKRGESEVGPNGVAIRFLGVFDTVEAYGVPFEELRLAIDRAVWPLSFRNKRLSENVATACHALSLDEERLSFKPIRFDAPSPDSSQTIDEVWFAGVHSDVGGGYPDGALSYLPLVWIAEEAERLGLRLCRGRLNGFRRQASPFGPLHDSRSGLASAYRYAPRVIQPQKSATVHHSVLEKMTLGSERYAPVPMPRRAIIRMPDGTSSALDPAGANPLNLPTAQRIFPQFAKVAQLPKPNGSYLALVDAQVWWRRVAYLALAWSATATVALPWIAEAVAGLSKRVLIDGGSLIGLEAGGRRLWEHLDATNSGLAGTVGVVSGSVGSLVPSYASRWVAVLSENTLISAIFIGATIGFYLWNERLKSSIQDSVHCAWAAGSPKAPAWRLSELADRARKSRPLLKFHRAVTRVVVPGFVGLVALVAVAVGLNALAVGFTAGEGSLCKATANGPDAVPSGAAGLTATFAPSNPCWSSGMLLTKGLAYRLTISETDAFLDSTLATGVSGFESSTWTYRLGTLVKRRSDAAWFQPVARIGKAGGTEWPLTHDDRTTPPDLGADFSAEIAALCKARARETKEPNRPSACNSLSGDARETLRQAVIARRLRHTLTATFVAPESGELFLYINDGLLAPGVPFSKQMYRNNSGAATVTVTLAPEPGAPLATRSEIRAP